MSLKPFTPETLIRVRRIAGHDISPDGRFSVLAVEDLADDGKSFRTNLLRVTLDNPSEHVWLTRDERKKGSPRFAPDGTLLFLCQPDPAAARPAHLPKPESDGKNGDDDPKKAPRQVFRMRVDGGAAEQLTDLPCGAEAFDAKAAGMLALLAGSHPAAKTVEENRELEKAWKDRKPTGLLYDGYPLRYWDHWHGPQHPHLVATTASGLQARDLTPGLGFGLFEATLDVSPAAAMACVDITTVDADKRFVQQLEIFDLATGARRQLTEGLIQHSAPRWSPDGTRLAALIFKNEPRKTGKHDLAIVDAKTGESRNVTANLDIWPDRPIWVDADRLVFAHDEEGHRVLRLLNWRTGDTRLLTTRGNAADPRLSPCGKQVFFTLDRVNDGPDLWRVPVDGGGEPVRVAGLNAPVLEGVALSPAESFTVSGDGGTPVQLYEVKPPDFDASRKYPLLLWIHGGPVHAYLDQFHFRWNAQIYAALGYVVIMVNPRGSTGFGQEFIEGNNGEWGGACYRDLMAATDEWVKKPYVDSTRVAALGASFGGYMANWIAGHEDRFKCLVSHAGLFHLPAFHGVTDAGPEWELEFGGKPWENPELYEKWSPSKFASSFKTPTLVIHGDLDYRVPIGEGLQMFLALQRQGVPSQFLYFPDENHWILKPANLLQWNQTIITWLTRWLS